MGNLIKLIPNFSPKINNLKNGPSFLGSGGANMLRLKLPMFSDNLCKKEDLYNSNSGCYKAQLVVYNCITLINTLSSRAVWYFVIYSQSPLRILIYGSPE